MHPTTLLLWLLTLNLGIAFGAGLYEARIGVRADFMEGSSPLHVRGVPWA